MGIRHRSHVATPEERHAVRWPMRVAGLGALGMLAGFGMLVWSAILPHNSAVVLAAPGEVVVRAQAPGGYLVWSEGGHAVDLRVGSVRLDVLAPDGTTLVVTPDHGRTARASLPRHSYSRRSFAAFDAPRPGEYRVRVTGDGPPRTLAITKDPGLTGWAFAAIFGFGTVMATGALRTFLIVERLKRAPSGRAVEAAHTPTTSGTLRQ